MLDKDPTSWPLPTWAMAVGLALLGGLINFYGKIHTGKSKPFNIVELVGELATSGFVGAVSFMAAQSLDVNLALSSAIAGVSGHMATRLLFVVEKAIESQLTKKLSNEE